MPDRLDLIFVVLGLLVSAGLISALGYALKKWIEEKIDEATSSIQPTANGGLSLPDAARAATEARDEVRSLRVTQLEIHEMLGELRGGFAAHLVNHAK